MTGVPAIQPGATPIARRQGPTRFRSEGSASTRWRAAPFLCRAIAISSAAPGTTCGNHRANYPRHLRAPSGMVFAVQMHEPTRKAGRNPERVPPYKRGGAGSNPAAPTKFLQLDGLFETLIGGQVTTAGNHRCILLPGMGKASRAAAASFDHEIGRTPQGIHHGHRCTIGCEAHPENVPGHLRESRARQGLGASGSSTHVPLASSGVSTHVVSRRCGGADV